MSGCELETAAKIGNVECQPGRTLFHDDGSLETCMLTADTKVGDYSCMKAPLSTSWHKGGALRDCSLVSTATIGSVTVTSGRGIQLYPDGKLKQGWTETAVVVDGWTCTKDVRLFADGTLEYCVVSVAGKVGAQAIPAGSALRITKKGKLRGLELGATAKVDGKPAKAGDRLCFDDAEKPEKSQSCWMF